MGQWEWMREWMRKQLTFQLSTVSMEVEINEFLSGIVVRGDNSGMYMYLIVLGVGNGDI